MNLSTELLRDPFGAIRRSCAEVAQRARQVRIDAPALARFARSIPASELGGVSGTALPDLGGDPERIAAFVIALDAINFGSGWFPQLNKPEGKSGYRTVEAALGRHFSERGGITAAELCAFDSMRMTALLGQSGAGPDVSELMELYATAWRELGSLVRDRHGGSFLALARSARGSAAALVRTLLELPLYRDVHRYQELEVPFLKRAQITVADLALAPGAELQPFADLDQLTMFADNLVPHVLRLDGVLVFAPELVERIERGALLEVGSPEEVEIRACAVEAVERLRAQLAERGARVRAMDLDFWLWTRGAGPRYKARPRHRARSACY